MSDMTIWVVDQSVLLIPCPWRLCPVFVYAITSHCLYKLHVMRHERANRRVWFCSMPTSKFAA